MLLTKWQLLAQFTRSIVIKDGMMTVYPKLATKGAETWGRKEEEGKETDCKRLRQKEMYLDTLTGEMLYLKAEGKLRGFAGSCNSTDDLFLLVGMA